MGATLGYAGGPIQVRTLLAKFGLRGDDALLTYKVAQLLDQQLRPVEALMRYQKFLLQMELQRIDAQGTRNAKLAEAIALAQQRVLVLDRRPR